MTSDFHGSQSSCCGDNSFPGGEKRQASQTLGGGFFLRLFFLYSKSHMRTHKSRHMEVICFDKCMYAEGFWKELVCQGQHRLEGISVKLQLIPLVRGRMVLNKFVFSILWNWWVKHPSKLQQQLSSLQNAVICVGHFSCSTSTCM